MKKMLVILLLAVAFRVFANPIALPTCINEVQIRPVSRFEIHIHPHSPDSVYPINFDGCSVTCSSGVFQVPNFTLTDKYTHAVIADSQLGVDFVLSPVADSLVFKDGSGTLLDMVLWPLDFAAPDSGFSAALLCSLQNSAQYFYWCVNCTTTFGSHNGGYDPDYQGVEGRGDSLKPEAFFEVYPNPASSQVVLSFMAPKGQSYDLKVYDLAGRLVKKIEEGVGEGRYITAIWMGINMDGRMVSEGTYFVVLHSEGRKTSRKITRFK